MSSCVGIVYSDAYRKISSISPKFEDRFSLVMDLLNAYGLVDHLLRIPPVECFSEPQEMELLTPFHSSEYIAAVERLSRLYSDDDEPILTKENEDFFDEYNLFYDCPGFTSLYEYSLASVRGSIAAADSLINNHCKVAINWAGGWHHAKRSQASGFCYFNDIVLAIIRLLSFSDRLINNVISLKTDTSSILKGLGLRPSTPARILYIDLDLHHGDGVEEAFWICPRVVTFSIHHSALGFFPGTGCGILVAEPQSRFDRGPAEPASLRLHWPTGSGRGQHSAFNLPLTDGATDAIWAEACWRVLAPLAQVVRPAAVVVQCGADCLASDPHRIFNLSSSPRGCGHVNSAFLDISDKVEQGAQEKLLPLEALLEVVNVSTEVTGLTVDQDSCQTPHPPCSTETDVYEPTHVGGYAALLRRILTWRLPTLLLGGGGYHFADSARLWTHLTQVAIDETKGLQLSLDPDIPIHSFLERYGPDYTVQVSAEPNRRDLNIPKTVDEHVRRLLHQVDMYAELNGLDRTPLTESS